VKTSNVQHPWHRANYGDDAPEKVRALIEIPQTLELDGDPLDILVLCSQTIQPLCSVDATNAPSVNHIKNIEEMPPHFIRELRHYFEQYIIQDAILPTGWVEELL
jgi:inorganic pyrophosphatase